MLLLRLLVVVLRLLRLLLLLLTLSYSLFAAVGAVIAQVKQAAVIVIDCNWNMGPGEITTNAPLIVQQLREEWSATKPIVLAEGTSAGDA